MAACSPHTRVVHYDFSTVVDGAISIESLALGARRQIEYDSDKGDNIYTAAEAKHDRDYRFKNVWNGTSFDSFDTLFDATSAVSAGPHNGFLYWNEPGLNSDGQLCELTQVFMWFE